MHASDMIDDLRDRLNDASDAQVPFATKLRYLNHGQNAMFPRIYRLVQNTTLVVEDDEYEYIFPSGIGTGKVISVEVEMGESSGRYLPYQDYDILPSSTAPILMIGTFSLPAAAGSRFRIVSADRLVPFVAADYADSGSVVYTGPIGTEELPVLYAMGLATARPMDDRMDYKRYAILQQNEPGPNDIMAVSQFWFSQFERMLDEIAMPFPVARG